MSKRMIETTYAFDGEEFEVGGHIDGTGIRIENGQHGEIYLDLADFDRVAAEVAAYRRAEQAAGDPRTYPDTARVKVVG